MRRNVRAVLIDSYEGQPRIERVTRRYEEIVRDPGGEEQDGDSFAAGHGPCHSELVNGILPVKWQ